ncbi:MAG: hypothetical protein EBX57_08335, partial [Betaproteobacteria bacterium]|nr:hypothetical protein [Betaproteobacteria bacterium]
SSAASDVYKRQEQCFPYPKLSELYRNDSSPRSAFHQQVDNTRALRRYEVGTAQVRSWHSAGTKLALSRYEVGTEQLLRIR